MLDLPHDKISATLAAHPYPLLFITLSGAHLYGFPSPDSDFDLRGVHLLPLPELLSLYPKRDTVEHSSKEGNFEADFVTHDAEKFFRLLLKKNGYVLEQLLSPLIIRTSPEHEELKAIGQRCVTKYHAYHYLGFAETQHKLFAKESPPRVKPLLYLYRVLLTGIHLMRTGDVQANLLTLNQEYNLPQIPDLIARKRTGPEKGTLPAADLPFHESEYLRLRTQLEAEMNATHLPETTDQQSALNDLLLRLRFRK